MTPSSSNPETYACFVKMCIIYPLANKKKELTTILGGDDL